MLSRHFYTLPIRLGLCGRESMSGEVHMLSRLARRWIHYPSRRAAKAWHPARTIKFVSLSLHLKLHQPMKAGRVEDLARLVEQSVVNVHRRFFLAHDFLVLEVHEHEEAVAGAAGGDQPGAVG